LRQAVNGLTMKIETLQTVVSDLMSIKSKFTQQPATPHVGRIPVSGSLVQTYLEGTPGARPVSFIMKEANARVSLLISKSSELLTRAKLIHADTDQSSAGDTEDESEEELTLREKLAEALVN
jgi:hypothetical protein